MTSCDEVSYRFLSRVNIQLIILWQHQSIVAACPRQTYRSNIQFQLSLSECKQKTVWWKWGLICEYDHQVWGKWRDRNIKENGTYKWNCFRQSQREWVMLMWVFSCKILFSFEFFTLMVFLLLNSTLPVNHNQAIHTSFQ